MNVPMNRPMTATPTQTAPTVQVHTSVSATVGTQVMEEIAQVLNIAKSLNHSQPVCNITQSYFLFPDVNECSNESTNDCDVNANCTNSPGSYNCQCISGFAGDGRNCSGNKSIDKVSKNTFSA